MCIYMCMCVFTCVCVYTYIYIYIHAHSVSGKCIDRKKEFGLWNLPNLENNIRHDTIWYGISV